MWSVCLKKTLCEQKTIFSNVNISSNLVDILDWTIEVTLIFNPLFDILNCFMLRFTHVVNLSQENPYVSKKRYFQMWISWVI